GQATRNLHLAFVARTHGEVDEWWRTMTGAGYRDDGTPGPRPQYHPDYYGAFVLDPDGNSVESVAVGRERAGDNRIDHLWLGVRDVEATRRFYERIAPVVGLRIHVANAERFHVAADDRSFGLVNDGRPPT